MDLFEDVFDIFPFENGGGYSIALSCASGKKEKNQEIARFFMLRVWMASIVAFSRLGKNCFQRH